MTTQIEAMKMMAEALECYEDSQGKPQYVIDALAAGRAAIEAAEKMAPVAWMIVYDGQCMGFTPTKETDLQVPVFTNPPSAEIEELQKDAESKMTAFEEWAKEYFGVCVDVPEACRDAWNAGAANQKEKDAAMVQAGCGYNWDEIAAAIRNQE